MRYWTITINMASITEDNVQEYLQEKDESEKMSAAKKERGDVLVFGSKGTQIAAKTKNQQLAGKCSSKLMMWFLPLDQPVPGKPIFPVALAVQSP